MHMYVVCIHTNGTFLVLGNMPCIKHIHVHIHCDQRANNQYV